MSKKLTFKINEILRSILFGIIAYSISLGIGYLIALFIDIPTYISFPIFFIFGILAVAIDIPDDTLKWFKYIPLLRRHFLMMHRVRMRIGISAKEGKLSSAYKFAGGLLIVIFYLFFLNLAIITIKLLLNLTNNINIKDPIRFTEAFLSLLGAGITAFIIWLRTFHREYRYMRTTFKNSRNFKERIQSVTKGISLAIMLYVLFISYLIWSVGLCLFLIGTIYFQDYFVYLVIVLGAFLMILITVVMLIIFLTKPEKKIPVVPSQE